MAKENDDTEEYINYQRERKTAKRLAKKAAITENKKIKAENSAKISTIKNGTAVRHGYFGDGLILSQTEDTIDINFNVIGQKRLLKKYTKLETIYCNQ